MPRRIARGGAEEGAVAVEMALAVIYLVLAILGIVYCGFYFWIWHTMQLAADEGARYAMVMYAPNKGPPSWSCPYGELAPCVEGYVRKTLDDYNLSNTAFTVYANCYTDPPSPATLVNCKTGDPDTMGIWIGYNWHFIFMPLTLAAGTWVPLIPLPSP